MAAGLNYWLTAVTRRKYVLVGSATASLLSTVTAVSQQLKQSELGRMFRVVNSVSLPVLNQRVRQELKVFLNGIKNADVRLRLWWPRGC